MDITETVALVTGGASGLGLVTVRRLHAGGAKIVIGDLPSSAGVAIAEELGDGVVFAAVDVTSEDDVQSAVEQAAALGELAIVVNCAGIGNGIRIVGQKGVYQLDAFRRAVEVNLVGTFNVVRLTADVLDEALRLAEDIGAEAEVIIRDRLGSAVSCAPGTRLPPPTGPRVMTPAVQLDKLDLRPCPQAGGAVRRAAARCSRPRRRSIATTAPRRVSSTGRTRSISARRPSELRRPSPFDPPRPGGRA